MKFTRNFLFPLVLVSASVAFGVAFEHKKFFPYYRVIEAYQQSEAKVKKRLGLAEEKPTKSTVAKLDFVIAERQIPSAILPLRISGVRLNAKLSVPVPGGAITVVGGKVVIVDRMGRFHIYEPGKNFAHSVDYPILPSNREAFFSWGRYGQTKSFRPHDIEYAETGGRNYLIVSNEFFDMKLKTIRLAVHRLQINPADLSPLGVWERIFESTPLPLYDIYTGRSAGGRLAVDGDFVYLTIGDYLQDGAFITSLKPPYPAQVKASDFGSIIKLNILTGKKEPISYGHRNPQGIMVSAKGEVISAEHGPRGGDELNFIKPGLNYGWPEVSLGMHYPDYSWHRSKSQGRHDGFTRPVFSWVPSIGISNLIEVREFNDRWDGDLLVGSLKAASLYRLRRDGEKVTYSEPIWIGQRIRDLAQLPNGTIVLWTDQTQLLFLSVDDKQLAGNKFAGIPLTVGGRLDKCLKCHHMGDTNPSHPAPSLSNLVGRAVAADKQFTKYTNAMKQLDGVWSRKRLTMFLTDPSGFVPGTSMAMEPMIDLRKVRKVIDELERAK